MKKSPRIRGLKPDTGTEDAARMVLRSRLTTLAKTIAKSNPTLSVEYVHQLRVGTRRVGAALRVFAALIPNRKLRQLREDLRNLRRAAAETRDWDVFIHFVNDSPDSEIKNYMLGYAQGVRGRTEWSLARTLAEQSQNLVASLVKLPKSVERSHSVPRTMGKFAEERMQAHLEKFQAALDEKPSTVGELHALRILGKRLRYAIELFRDCLPAESTEAYLTQLSSLQSTLGAIQDSTVFAGHVAEIQATVDKSHAKEFKAVLKSLTQMERRNRAEFRKWQAGWKKLQTNIPVSFTGT